MPREASAEQRYALPEMEGVTRRVLATAGVATLMSTLAAPSGAQEVPIEPDEEACLRYAV
jgi:hypothetical protein